MNICKIMIVSAAIGSFVVSSGWAQDKASQDEQVKIYIEMMRKDIRADANAIVDEAMGLDPAGKAIFQGIYDKYAKEVAVIWDQRLANIMKYADHFENMTDPIAEELANKALKIQSDQLKIQKKYYGQMKAALGVRVAGRFLQVEALLNDLINLQVRSEIPLLD